MRAAFSDQWWLTAIGLPEVYVHRRFIILEVKCESITGSKKTSGRCTCSRGDIRSLMAVSECSCFGDNVWDQAIVQLMDEGSVIASIHDKIHAGDPKFLSVMPSAKITLAPIS